MDEQVNIAFRIKERHDAEVVLIGTSQPPIKRGENWSWDRYFVRCGTLATSFPGYLENPPTPQVRFFEDWWMGRFFYRIVKDREKWFIELLEEVSVEAVAQV